LEHFSKELKVRLLYRTIPKVTARLLLHLAGKRGRYLRVGVNFGWLKKVSDGNIRFRQSGRVTHEMKSFVNVYS